MRPYSKRAIGQYIPADKGSQGGRVAETYLEVMAGRSQYVAII